LAVAFFATGSYQRTNAQTPPTPTSSQADSDAAAKAAERKKRFAEAKKALENQEPPAPQVKTQNQPFDAHSTGKPAEQPTTKVVFTIPVTMAVGESQAFHLYDEKRGQVTSEAQWTLIGDSLAADLTIVGGVPTVTSKNTGAVALRGVLGDRSAIATIDVVTKDQIANMTRWSQLPQKERASLTIIPAVPSMRPRR
jgi:hypothetical protein